MRPNDPTVDHGRISIWTGPVDDDAPTCLGQDHDADLLPVRWYGFQLVR